MAQITITINSREYAVACEDGQETRIIQLSRILDEKAKMITQGLGQVNESLLLAMVGLLLADELSELKKGAPEPANAAQLLETDEEIAAKIKVLSNQIKCVASQINLI